MSNKLPVAILGATGLVGSTYKKLLEHHPFFALTQTPSTTSLSEAGVVSALAKQAKVVFSALKNTELAKNVERSLAEQGALVISSSAYWRDNPLVPLMMPEINGEHLALLALQRKAWGLSGQGGIIAKPNCTLPSFLLPLYPLHQAFGVKQVMTVSFQSTSGMGKAFDLKGNVLPFIEGEEEKSEQEPLKILAKMGEAGLESVAPMPISAQCNRVAVDIGHQVCVFASLEKEVHLDEIKRAWLEFNPLKGVRENLFMAPDRLIHYHEQALRPQPLLDREYERGMGVSVGRLRQCSITDIKFVALSNNLIRGAAGGGLLAAEMAYAKGWITL